MSDLIYCEKCGQQNGDNNFRCTRCSHCLIRPARPVYVVTDDGTLGGLVPYKNPQALLAYYFGVFSLIPCIGVPLGVTAVVLGVKGLKHAALHQSSGGKGHAWSGVVLGAFCVIVNLIAIAIVLVMGMTK